MFKVVPSGTFTFLTAILMRVIYLARYMATPL